MDCSGHFTSSEKSIAGRLVHVFTREDVETLNINGTAICDQNSYCSRMSALMTGQGDLNIHKKIWALKPHYL